MIEKIYGTPRFEVCCDDHRCFTQIIVVEAEGCLKTLAAILRKKGWRTLHDNRVWRHYCPKPHVKK